MLQLRRGDIRCLLLIRCSSYLTRGRGPVFWLGNRHLNIVRMCWDRRFLRSPKFTISDIWSRRESEDESYTGRRRRRRRTSVSRRPIQFGCPGPFVNEPECVLGACQSTWGSSLDSGAHSLLDQGCNPCYRIVVSNRQSGEPRGNRTVSGEH